MLNRLNDLNQNFRMNGVVRLEEEDINNIDMELLTQIKTIFLDPWVLFGFLAQFVFFARFIVQWYVSERAGRVTVPKTFWYLSIAGALMILIYSIHRQDIVFIAGQLFALFIYIRNIMIESKWERL